MSSPGSPSYSDNEDNDGLMYHTYALLRNMFHRGRPDMHRTRELLQTFPRLPVPIQPLKHSDLKYELEQRISDGGIRATVDHLTKRTATEASSASIDRLKRDRVNGNSVDMILGREAGLGAKNNWTSSQKRCALYPTHLPSYPSRVVDDLEGHSYVGQFSSDGELFVNCLKDSRILVYRPDDNWSIQKHISARMLSWTITDTCFSHDARFLLYSTISPVLHVVKVQGQDSVVDSQANITEIHEPIYIEEENDYGMFGIWSIAWSKVNAEIIVGTSCLSKLICLYDMQSQTTVASLTGHNDHVGAVTYLDDSSQVFASGSDDSLIKIWDKRILTNSSQSAAGTLIGHTEGLTHLDSKGDGRYLISNAKDQTIKLWDIRTMNTGSSSETSQNANTVLPHFYWDYRMNVYPGRYHAIKHPQDSSLMTFRGHSVLRTLIRAYFSPQFSTGQRYVYTGCHSGTIRIFDVLTGELVKELKEHRDIVRDCSWHPYHASIVSTSWDGRIIEWTPHEN